MPRCPAKDLCGEVSPGNELRRITRPTRGINCADGKARNLFDHLDDLPDRVASPGAEIYPLACAAIDQFFDR